LVSVSDVCSDELAKANSAVATKETESEEKNTTIVQVFA